MAIKHEIRDNEIFVFGSNKAGKHGLGTALTARMKYGAKMGQGFGLQGQSLAIPVKDEQLKLLPLEEIKTYVDLFIDFAKTNFDKRFFVTPVGRPTAGAAPEFGRGAASGAGRGPGRPGFGPCGRRR